ncbi:hypothetical protein V5E97_25545 [Singulisphaera sp. Ch08]|uniref:Uncharacterized protein n=1 Tax=Singulisphaera sp. Ch08 TaxID=3120278 RepID=A0AAU7C8U8_9BACT
MKSSRIERAKAFVSTAISYTSLISAPISPPWLAIQASISEAFKSHGRFVSTAGEIDNKIHEVGNSGRAPEP